MTRALALLTLIGCSGDTIHDQFDVVSDGAVIPVGVYGDIASGTLVVYESGGPSGPGIAERMVDYIDFRDTLEQDVAIAFYDRRGTGNCTGDYDTEDITMEALIADLRAVTRVLDDRYAPERKVLMGHSFGAMSAPLYLAEHPDTYDAWVAVAPAWTNQDVAMENAYRRLFLQRVATERIAIGDDDPMWPEALAFCEEHPVIEPWSEAHERFYDDFLIPLGREFEPDPTMSTVGLLGTVFGTSYNLIDTQLRGNRISEAVWGDLDGVNLLDELEQVDHPVLVVSGQYDAIGNTELGLAGLERMATPEADKRLVQLDDGGHYPFDADPEGFRDEVLALIDRLDGAAGE